MRPWTVLKSRYLLRRKWLSVRREHLRLPDGAEIPEFYVLESPDWATVVCLTESGEVVLVEQYRRAVDAATLELPSGIVEPGEDPLVGAQRELLEETGYAAGDWVPLGRFAPNPARQTNFAHVYFARGARRVAEPQLDAAEDLCVRLVAPGALLRLIAAGDILHAVHALAILSAAQRGLLALD